MMKTKTIEIEELGIKITVEWTEKEQQLNLQLHSLTMANIETQVLTRVLGDSAAAAMLSLAVRDKHQYIAHARHIFCYACIRAYGFSYSQVALYLRRSEDSIKHSVKRVVNCNQKTDGALWSAFMRYDL